MMLNIRELEDFVGESMAGAQVPGLALAVIDSDRIAYARGFGVTRVEEGSPVTPGTLFRIGSVTKPMTGTAVMRLVEQGLLGLDAPVKQYLPWLRFREAGAEERITLRLLMSHQSGLPWEYEPDGARDPAGLEAYLRERMPEYVFMAPPGTVYSYSNPGLNLVGGIAQAVARQPFPQLVQELVFEPLKMGRATFDPLAATTYPLAQSHWKDEEGRLHVRRRHVENTGWHPAGYVFASVLDLSNFALAHLNRGRFRGRRVLSEESVAEMHRPHAEIYGSLGNTYGLTWGIHDYKGVRRVGHGGAISHYGSRLTLAPDHGLAVAMSWNRLTEDFDADAVVNRIFDEAFGLPAGAPQPETIEPDRSRWTNYTGAYLGRYRGLVVVRREEDRLLMDWNRETMAPDVLRQDLFWVRGEKGNVRATFGFSGDGEGPASYLMANNSPCPRFDAGAVPTTDPADWEALVGRYCFENHTLEVSLADGRLHIGTAGSEAKPAIPVGPRSFACMEGVVEFDLPREGASPALIIGQSYLYRRQAASP